MSGIQLEGINVSYDSVEALRNVSFDIGKNEFVGIIGPNGGGKTTLIKTILGLIQPNSGQVLIDKDAVLGYVPQFTSFDRKFPILVEEVILTGHLPKKFKFIKNFSSHEKKHAAKVMKQLGIDSLKKRQIGALSGGQMQRVLIARALMNHPTVLVLDEPTAGVDEQSKAAIYQILGELYGKITILMITHDTDEIIERFNKVIYINKTVHMHEQCCEPSNWIKNSTTLPDYNMSDEEDACPIDWFVAGNKIQNDMMQDSTTKDDLMQGDTK